MENEKTNEAKNDIPNRPKGAALSGTAKPVTKQDIEKLVSDKFASTQEKQEPREATCTEMINAMNNGLAELAQRTGLIIEGHAKLGAIKVLAVTEEAILIAAINERQLAYQTEVMRAMMQKGNHSEQ